MIFDFQMEERMFGMLGGVGRPLSFLVWHIERDGVISFISLPKSRWLWQQKCLPSYPLERASFLSTILSSILRDDLQYLLLQSLNLVLNISFQSFLTTIHGKKCTVHLNLPFSYTQNTLFSFPAHITVCNPKFGDCLFYVSCRPTCSSWTGGFRRVSFVNLQMFRA